MVLLVLEYLDIVMFWHSTPGFNRILHAGKSSRDVSPSTLHLHHGACTFAAGLADGNLSM